MVNCLQPSEPVDQKNSFNQRMALHLMSKLLFHSSETFRLIGIPVCALNCVE